MTKLQKTLAAIPLMVVLFLSFVHIADAVTILQDVPDDPDNLCSFVIVIANIKNLALLIAGPITVLMIIIGGIMITVSAGQQNLRTQGKKTVTGGIIGLVIVLLAWTIVGAVLTATMGGGSSAWWTVPCS